MRERSTGPGLSKAGTGTLLLAGDDNFSGDIKVTGGTLTVAHTLYKDRAVTVSGIGSTLYLPRDDVEPIKFYVGFLDGGTLSITDGGSVVTHDICYIGYACTGMATVSGPGSTWLSNDGIFVGYHNGTLNIADGGSVTTDTCSVGATSTSTGTVTVDGAGSTLYTSWSLDVGFSGNGTLTVTNGGTVSGAAGGVGTYSGGTGTATVDGPGSTWTNSGDLRVAAAYGYVGGTCSGTLNIANGGSVSNANGHVGCLSGATGTVTVSGAESTWTNSGSLYVGEGGTGSVTQTGGTVSVAGTLCLGSDATSNGTYNLNGGTLTIKSLAKGAEQPHSILAAEPFRPTTPFPPTCPSP